MLFVMSFFRVMNIIYCSEVIHDQTVYYLVHINTVNEKQKIFKWNVSHANHTLLSIDNY